MSRSPFLVIEELVSPLQCEDMIQRLNHTIPNTDQKGDPTLTLKGNRLSEIRIMPRFKQVLPDIEKYYGFETRTMTPFNFEWYPTGYSGAAAKSEAYQMLGKRGKQATWNKVKDYDFTVIVFLNDYNEGTDFDADFEVRGGKLEFPTHDFGFTPVRGTTVIFPTRPQFVHAVSPVEAGDLNLIRFHIIAKEEYNYNMNDFPGGYREWFNF